MNRTATSVPFLRTPLARVAAVALLGTLCGAAAVDPGDPVPGIGQLGGPIGPMTQSEYRLWRQGRELFDHSFTPAEGLGVPEFNADSCRACHSDPVMGGAGALEVNVARFGNFNGGVGPFTNLPGGQAASKLRPPPTATRENYPADLPNPLDNADAFEQRQTPSLLGMGLIDGISDAEILSNQDIGDVNGDGIFGIARTLTVLGQPEVGRFGWKAQIPHTFDFVRDAMGGECGITTPDDGRGFAFITDPDTHSDPEFSQVQVDKLTFFLNKLGPPPQGDLSSPQAQAGALVFTALRCDRCHIPSLEGANGPVNVYSDLLLHNVQGVNYKGMGEPGAGVAMFRTTPLWGVKDTAPYLHDGAAETISSAITMHRGEGLYSSLAFGQLSPTDRHNLIVFLNQL